MLPQTETSSSSSSSSSSTRTRTRTTIPPTTTPTTSRKRSSMLAWARMVAGRKIVKKYREAHMKSLQRMEYRRLRDLIPWLRRKAEHNERVSKVEVIENTIKYIDQLHKALAEKIQQQQQQQGDDEVQFSPDEASEIARRMFSDHRGEKFKPWAPPSTDPPPPTPPPTPSATHAPTHPATNATLSSHHPGPSNLRSSWNVCIKRRQLPSYLVQSNVLQDMSDSYKSDSF